MKFEKPVTISRGQGKQLQAFRYMSETLAKVSLNVQLTCCCVN